MRADLNLQVQILQDEIAFLETVIDHMQVDLQRARMTVANLLQQDQGNGESITNLDVIRTALQHIQVDIENAQNKLLDFQEIPF